MSTVPGDDALRDAGLTPGEITHLAQQDDDDQDVLDEGDYEPGPPRPDLDGEADEVDVVEQGDEVPGYDDGDPA
jgi:hypothetical protein